MRHLLRKIMLGGGVVMLGGCGRGSAVDADAERARIERQIQRGVEATRAQDIDTYMSLIPEESLLRGPDGSATTRDQLRASVLRDWSIIPATLDIAVTIDSLTVHGDSAVVYTSQRWARLMLQRDGVTRDTVVTTQRHREHWRRTAGDWMAFEVEELGGTVAINGKPYPG